MNVQIVVQTSHGETDPFKIKVGLHQRSALSPFLFVVVLDTISETCRRGIPWEPLFADDLVVMGRTVEELQQYWLKWQKMLASHGLKVNTTKTEVMASTRIYKDMNVVDNNDIVSKQVDGFKYLGLMLSEKGGSWMAVTARVNAAWMKWKEMSGVIYDKRMPRKLKVKLYKTVIRPVLTYGAET